MSAAPPPAPGTYALLWYAPRGGRTCIGALGECAFDRGWSVYFGSAHGGGGLAARIGRHRREDKVLRWHMDYLRPHLRLAEVWWRASERRHESDWVGAALARGWRVAIAGFGASDSHFPSHLLAPQQRPRRADWQQIATRATRWRP